MRSMKAIALALMVQLIGVGIAPAQKILEENPYYLRADKRLQVTLNVEADHPKLSQIIVHLREATGLDIDVGGSLYDHDPDYGHIQPSKKGYRAWQIMEMVAKKNLQHGYWDKTDRGYRLLGDSTKGDESAPPYEPLRIPLAWNLSIMGSLLVILVTMIVIHKRNTGSWFPPSG